MSDMMKKMGKAGNKGMLRGMMGQMIGKSTGLPQVPVGADNTNKGTEGNTFSNFPNVSLPKNLSGFAKKK